MQGTANNKRKYWITALVLLILVALTAAYLCMRLGIFAPKESQDYIPLVPNSSNSDGGQSSDGSSDSTDASGNSSATSPTGSTFVAEPGMSITDQKQVWSTNTVIDLFKIDYKNGEEVYTVKSDDNTKVIAPGTENTYTFRLKNTGNVAMDFSVMMDAYYSTNTQHIPVQVRMCNYYGQYIIGSADTYAPVMELKGLQDHATLGVGSYAYYTLEWTWPYEWGGDHIDTQLGNLAVQEPVTLTIEINTLASQSEDPNATGGILPATGDDFQPMFWGIVCVAALIGIIVLLICWKRARREEKDEV